MQQKLPPMAMKGKTPWTQAKIIIKYSSSHKVWSPKKSSSTQSSSLVQESFGKSPVFDATKIFHIFQRYHRSTSLLVDTRVCEFRWPRNFLSVSVLRSWKSADRGVPPKSVIFLFTMENFIKKMYTGHYVFLIILVFIDVECSIFISRLNIIDAN